MWVNRVIILWRSRTLINEGMFRNTLLGMLDTQCPNKRSKLIPDLWKEVIGIILKHSYKIYARSLDWNLATQFQLNQNKIWQGKKISEKWFLIKTIDQISWAKNFIAKQRMFKFERRGIINAGFKIWMGEKALI